MLQAIFRLVLAASLAAAGLMPSGAPSRAAAMAAAMTGQAPRHRALPLLPAQAPPPAPNIEANIAQLYQRLQITPTQEPRFEALANVMRQNARMMPNAPPPTNLDPIQGLRFAIQTDEQELVGLKRMLPPLQALYASLSPTQQRIADQVFRQGPEGEGFAGHSSLTSPRTPATANDLFDTAARRSHLLRASSSVAAAERSCRSWARSSILGRK